MAGRGRCWSRLVFVLVLPVRQEGQHYDMISGWMTAAAMDTVPLLRPILEEFAIELLDRYISSYDKLYVAVRRCRATFKS